MKLSEIQSHNISHRVNIPFPIQWSEDDVIATATDKGLQLLKSSVMRSRNKICNWCNNAPSMQITRIIYFATIIMSLLIQPSLCSDTKSNITDEVFGYATKNLPAAFGDFDSDKYTDLFALTADSKTVKILLGSDSEPFLRENEKLKCTFKDDLLITSVVPGDFDGDAFMDVLVTVRQRDWKNFNNDVYLLWGHGDKLNCDVTKPLFSVHGQPLAVDWDQNMVIDLFGMHLNHTGTLERGFWVFNKNRTQPSYRPMKMPEHMKFDQLRVPHSHAFLDLNNDNFGDLYLTTANGSAEVWYYDNGVKDFVFNHIIEPPPGYDHKNEAHYIGQTLFQDMALEKKINQVIPVCFSDDCLDSTIFVRSEDGAQAHWYGIKVDYKHWHLASPKSGSRMYLETLTLRAGDYNMDGYPDLLATLHYNGEYRVNLLENVPCKSASKNCDGYPRTFEIREDALTPYNGNTTLGIFYDFYQNGILDIILVHDKPVMVSAFRNTLDYDANFVKVMVLTGVTHEIPPSFPLIKKRIYGTNLPGPTIFYITTTVEGDPKSAISAQLPQSAHFALSLPYTIFGLGRTANFVDELSVGVYGQQGNWTQLIPNSQMVVVPWPADNAKKWKVKLFVTPSELIIQSFCALLGTCALISLIIGGLYWKERKEDHRERLQEAQRFHFDAM